jgi:pantoate--beta-alanine ligase
MEIIKKKSEMRRIVDDAKARGERVGLVPTMGFFHEGHLALMRRARSECDVVVVSLFVNPTQFGPGEDLEAYPRDFERDRALADDVGVDYIFAPEVEEMYPAGTATSVEVEELSKVMCGRSRPGHFRGVATVVAKLFNIVPAQKAYFGQKDAQQLVIIRKMAADLDFGVEVISVPTVRESDGVAMSSRNTYLEPDERAEAVALYRSLEAARTLVEEGERRAETVASAMEEVISTFPLVNLEYIFICDNIFLRPLEELAGEVLVAVAARIGRARLIDNMLLTVE